MEHVKSPRQNEEFTVTDFALAEDELTRLKEAQGIDDRTWWVRLGDRYYEKKAARTLHAVNRKKYLWLTILLGWCGIHRFYEKRYVLGGIYLALCWTALPIALALVDWMIAVPKKADEDGNIMI